MLETGVFLLEAAVGGTQRVPRIGPRGVSYRLFPWFLASSANMSSSSSSTSKGIWTKQNINDYVLKVGFKFNIKMSNTRHLHVSSFHNFRQTNLAIIDNWLIVLGTTGQRVSSETGYPSVCCSITSFSKVKFFLQSTDTVKKMKKEDNMQSQT